MSKEEKKDIIPLSIYQSKQIKPGNNKIVFDFGSTVSNNNKKLLYENDESFLIQESIKPPYTISELLKSVNINFPQCWLLIEIPTKFLISNWKYEKPGDIDIVAGNISNENEFLFEYIVGIQVKLRKISSADELKSFPSGTGTKQSYYTAHMGFDRTLLLHFLTREPKTLPSGYAESWNPIVNSDFFRGINASKNLIKERSNKSRILYGYGILGWGQALGYDWNECGAYSTQLLYEPPLRPLRDKVEVCANRETFIESVKNILRKHTPNRHPFIRNFKK